MITIKPLSEGTALGEFFYDLAPCDSSLTPLDCLLLADILYASQLQQAYLTL